jgi:alpha-galactosidase
MKRILLFGLRLNYLFLPLFILGMLPCIAVAQLNNDIQQVPNPNGGWLIRTKSSAYQLLVTANKKVFPLFYGPVAQADNQKRAVPRIPRFEEIPARGGSPNKTPLLEVIYADNVRRANLEYVSGQVITIDGRPTLKIIQKDTEHPLEVISYIRVLAEFDILEKWIEVKNTGKEGNIKIQNLLSGSISLPTDTYELTQLSGGELGEFQPYTSILTPGSKVIENKLFKSNNNMPWFLLRPKSTANDANGPAWWGCVHYSGNWKLIFDNAFERAHNYTLQVSGGINFWDTEWTLRAGENFITPKFSVGYTLDGAEGAARSNAAYVRETILPTKHRKTFRPVLFNGWVPTLFNVNDSVELSLAKIASSVGVELFAIDDGWFKGRNTGSEGIGDWEVDKKKFPNGLGPLIDSVHAMGMKFGLWVEPEGIMTKSDVYRKHPEWVLGYSKKRPTPTRSFINLAREDVYQHLYTVLNNLLTNNKIDFIKWDQNTVLSDPDWAGASASLQEEVRIRFISNVYRLVDALRKSHPDVLFESCASGGGRVDLGMLSRMDQVWTSDNSISVDRLFIQYSFLGALPANTMESWILGDYINQQNNLPTLSYKFDVAMSGLLGIGCDIRKWTPEDRALAKKKIEIYKLVRPMVQQGTLHRLVSPFTNNRCALQYNSQDNDSSVVFFYNLALYVTANYSKVPELFGGAQYLNQGSTVLKLKGLIPGKRYKIQEAGDDKSKGEVYSGDYLMNVGIEWPVKAPFESRIMLVNKVE